MVRLANGDSNGVCETAAGLVVGGKWCHIALSMSTKGSHWSAEKPAAKQTCDIALLVNGEPSLVGQQVKFDLHSMLSSSSECSDISDQTDLAFLGRTGL
jgi:hypothetical protein